MGSAYAGKSALKEKEKGRTKGGAVKEHRTVVPLVQLADQADESHSDDSVQQSLRAPIQAQPNYSRQGARGGQERT